MVESRLQYVDILKGLGILSVLIGHILYPPLSKIMYIFHMPLFFFIGGYLFKIKTEKRKFLVDKCIQLLIPYTVYLFIIYSVNTYIYFHAHPHLSIWDTLLFLSYPFLGGNWLSGSATVFWFVTCFFLAQQFFNFTITYFSNKVIPLIMLVLVIFSYLNSFYFIRIPWSANVVLMATPLFYFGYLSKQNKFEPNILIVLLVCVLAVVIFLKGYPNYFDMKVSYYGIPIISLISCLSFIYILLAVSKIFQKYRIIANSFSQLGEASMVIMYLHQPVQLLIGSFFTQNVYMRLLGAIIIPLTFYNIFKLFKLTRAFFLGSKYDFLQTFNKSTAILATQGDKITS